MTWAVHQPAPHNWLFRSRTKDLSLLQQKRSTFSLLKAIKVMQFKEYFCKPRIKLYYKQIFFSTKGFF